MVRIIYKIRGRNDPKKVALIKKILSSTPALAKIQELDELDVVIKPRFSFLSFFVQIPPLFVISPSKGDAYKLHFATKKVSLDPKILQPQIMHELTHIYHLEVAGGRKKWDSHTTNLQKQLQEKQTIELREMLVGFLAKVQAEGLALFAENDASGKTQRNWDHLAKTYQKAQVAALGASKKFDTLMEKIQTLPKGNIRRRLAYYKYYKLIKYRQKFLHHAYDIGYHMVVTIMLYGKSNASTQKLAKKGHLAFVQLYEKIVRKSLPQLTPVLTLNKDHHNKYSLCYQTLMDKINELPK